MKNEIAIYGKGGIGKSTLSANLSAALSQKNKVLQIGCDPKHDSTRLLLGGRRIGTVLDYIRETGPLDYRLEDILFTGYGGIGCIEAGGPKPGVGCAGRGIITAFELLEKFHLKDRYDYVLYDVLGDVVCGGFAVPIRREYADTIFLVTSGEFMSIYAANNILRGIRNYDGDRKRVAGILFNSRNVTAEDEKVRAFADAVGIPVFAKIPRDDAFAQAERAGMTLVEQSHPLSSIFRDIAGRIQEGPPLYEARPLTDEALEELILGAAVKSVSAGAGALSTQPVPSARPADGEHAQSDAQPTLADSDYDAGYLSKNVIREEPLHGCAFNGAMCMSVNLRDAVILAHSPKSCIYLSYQTISSTGRRALFERGSLMPSSILPNLMSTDMEESDMVFGGTDKLLDAVREAKKLDPAAIVVISSCPSGIIGDDIQEAKTLSTPECPVVTIETDGNLVGDYLQGMLMCYTELARQIIDPDVPQAQDMVNIVFEKVVARNTETNFAIIRDYLARMGIRVGCRFLCETTTDSLRNFCAAPLNLLGYKDYTGQILQDFFENEYGSRFYEEQLPVGFEETSRWLLGVGAFFGKEEIARQIIDEQQAIYEERIAAVRPVLTGRRLMIITYNHQLDWILSAALDAGMEIVKLGIMNYSQDEGFRSSLPQAADLDVEDPYDPEQKLDDVRRLAPDILLTNYQSEMGGLSVTLDTIPMCPDVGFFSGLEMVERWTRIFDSGQEGDWCNDRYLLKKYYAR